MKENYQAGQLDRQLFLQYPTETRNGHGAKNLIYEQESSATPCHLPTGKGDENGTETEDEQTTKGSQTRTFVIRYRGDIKPTWRLSYEGQIYDILAAPEGSGRMQWTKIKAKATDVLNPS